MVLEFHELEYCEKLIFHKIELKKSSKLLNISQIVIHCKIFKKEEEVVFSYFGLAIVQFGASPLTHKRERDSQLWDKSSYG